MVSDLGGGNHGHLGIGIAGSQYHAVLNISYIQSGYPRSNAPVGATQHETVTQRNNWKRALELFKEIANVKKAIKNQIIEAIYENYLKKRIN